MSKAIRIHVNGGPEVMLWEDIPTPEPGPGEALVRLHAATLNFRDLTMAKGLIPGIAKEPDLVPLSCGAAPNTSAPPE